VISLCSDRITPDPLALSSVSLAPQIEEARSAFPVALQQQPGFKGVPTKEQVEMVRLSLNPPVSS
jgi:hypothetical protein